MKSLVATTNRKETIPYPVHWKSVSARFPLSVIWEHDPSLVCLPFKAFSGGLSGVNQGLTYPKF